MIKPTLKTSKLKDSPQFEFDMKFPIFKSSEKMYTITPSSVKMSLMDVCKILQSYGKDREFFLFASGFISGVMFDRIVFGK
jgi:hypothetical protein